MGKPDWGEIGASIIHPDMEFKGLKIEDYKFTLWDVIIGSIATIAVAFFIVVACASTLHANGIVIGEAKDAALALEPFAGPIAAQIFALGLFVASVFAATILPIATAFYVCEAFGFEAGIDKKYHEAPQFYILYTIILVIAVAIILIPNAPLILITLWSQVLNGILLPIVLICMMLLVNNKEIMGEFINKPFNNIVGWTTTIILVGLTIALLIGSAKTL
ncbi:MAG: Divalent metal cation transporter MntH [Candidatus Dichloromethanomonas elyunquensis]|nr:MAG: Divalent metal cation transporter MntH [Candidatus Dichloromethanomonas elyunquensis]